MPFECNLKVSGISPQTSAKAFMQSYIDTSNPQYYQRYNKYLEEYFQAELQKSSQQARIKEKNLEKNFFVDFKSNGIYFVSKSKKALQYEFGSKNTPPKRYIEPAVIKTANKLSEIMISDAINAYNKYSTIL